MRLTPAPLLVALTLAAPPAQVAGQNNQTRCAELIMQIGQLEQSIRKDEAARQGFYAETVTLEEAARLAREQALVFIKDDLWRDLLNWEEEAGKMRRIREILNLSPALDAHVSDGKAWRFWNGVEQELNARLVTRGTDDARQYRSIVARQDQLDALRAEFQRDCQPGPQSTAPPVERLRNIPVLTDGVISRWLRAWQARDQSGGAYWQAGQMTQRDFLDIKDKVERWSIYCGDANRRPEQDITEAECGVLRTRRPDILNAQAGKWSEVKM